LKLKLPLFTIYWDQDDIDAINKVIRRGAYWATGPEITEFEKNIAEYVGTKYAVVFNSGTSALHSILLALDVKQGDEVIVPSFTFISTANSVIFTGAKPVLADIETHTFGLDLDDVQKKITRKTKAIIPVHYAGCPCYYTKELCEIAEENGISLIEDAAAALGGKIGNKKAGTFGDAAMFSFCQNKIITTGDGGAIVTDSERLYKKMKLTVSHGKSEDYIALGYNFRMPTMNAALGCSQLKKIDKILDMRKKVAESYTSQLKNIKNVKPMIPPDNFHHTYWIYTIEVENNLRERLKAHLAKNGIFSKLYYDPIHLTTFYKNMFGYKTGDLPITENVCKKALSLPMSPILTMKEISYVTETIRSILK